jgi:hypothetical protein
LFGFLRTNKQHSNSEIIENWEEKQTIRTPNYTIGGFKNTQWTTYLIEREVSM